MREGARGEHSRAVGGLAALGHIGAVPVQAIISALALARALVDAAVAPGAPFIFPASPPTIKRGGTDCL